MHPQNNCLILHNMPTLPRHPPYKLNVANRSTVNKTATSNEHVDWVFLWHRWLRPTPAVKKFRDCFSL